jgi:hypothetical protein
MRLPITQLQVQRELHTLARILDLEPVEQMVVREKRKAQDPEQELMQMAQMVVMAV